MKTDVQVDELIVSTSIDGWTISSSTWTSVFIDVITFNLGLEKVIQIE